VIHGFGFANPYGVQKARFGDSICPKVFIRFVSRIRIRVKFSKYLTIPRATVGMFDNVLFDNSKPIMYDKEKVSFFGDR